VVSALPGPKAGSVIDSTSSVLADDVLAARSGIGLCLSGGGFRAALFHLGALRRLHELGILQRIRWISSVSGGSIIAGHLAQCQLRNGREGRLEFDNWQTDVVEPFRRFAARDLRTWPVLKNALWNWFLPGPLLRSLESRYAKWVTSMRLTDLPELPEYVFCATDLTFGVNWEFSRKRVGSYKAAWHLPHDVTVARAITASACFPPLFGPMRINTPHIISLGESPDASTRAKRPETIALTDGGVYDNMATEPVWKKAATVLVSDCGAPFEFVEGRPPWRTLLRYSAVLSRQAQSLRIRALQGVWHREPSARVYDGTRWHLASGKSAKSPAGSEGYSEDLAKRWIAAIRTDLDNFSEAEMSILENHGYLNADYRIRYEMNNLVQSDVKPESLTPNAPYPAWMQEDKVRVALQDSHKRLVLRRLMKGLFGLSIS
jgi:NTE family protein